MVSVSGLGCAHSHIVVSYVVGSFPTAKCWLIQVGLGWDDFGDLAVLHVSFIFQQISLGMLS